MSDQNALDLASQAKALLGRGSSATLATHSLKRPGFPFASWTPYALDDQGRPLIFVSGMATHTRNLKANPNAALFVSADKSQSGGRVTLVGTIEEVPQGERADAMQRYLQRHPEAQQWASFGDFAMLRMNILDVYIVAGFGSMGWVKAEDYLA